MRYRKIYKIKANEAKVTFKLGEVTVNGHFVNGNIRDNEWARLETSDPLVQLVIESSPLYGNKVMLDAAYEIEGSEAEEQPKAEPKKEEPNNIHDTSYVTSQYEARMHMVKFYGENLKSISSPNALKASMKRHGVEFPNLNF
jgi:hypothetical protein